MKDRDSGPSHLLGEARAALARWDISGAKSVIFAALKHSQQDGAYDVEHKAWMALAIAQRAEDEHEAALHSLLAAESAARAASDILAFACARMSRCACLVGVGRWSDAHSLREALVREHGDEVMARAMVEPHVDGSLLLSLASAYMEVDMNKARAAFERAIVVSAEPIMAARAYAGLGRVLDALALYDEAVLVFTRLAELAEGLGQSEFAAQVQKWIACGVEERMVEVLALLILLVSIGVVIEVYRARVVAQKLLSVIESHLREGLTWRTEHHAKVTELLSRIIEVMDRSTLPAPPPVMSASVRPAPMSTAVAPTARQPMPVDDPADSGRLPFEREQEDLRAPLLPLDRLLPESTRSEGGEGDRAEQRMNPTSQEVLP